MKILNQLLKGAALRNIEFLVMVLITFLMTPFVVHSLGDRMYGLWAVIGNLVGYYGLLDLGITSAVGRLLSKEIGRNQMDSASAVASTSFMLMIGAGCLALLVTLGAYLLSALFIDKAELILFRKLIVLLGASIAFGFPMRVFEAILTSNLRYDIMTFTSIAKNIVVNSFIYYFLSHGYGLLSITVINIAGSVGQFVLIFLYCKFIFPSIKIKIKSINREHLRSLFDYSWKALLGKIIDIVRFRVDSFIIAGFLNLSAVTYYAIGVRLIEYFSNLVQSTTGILTPVFSMYDGRHDQEAVNNLFVKATRISMAISIFLGSSIYFYSTSFICTWMGPGFERSACVAKILAVSYTLALCQNPSVTMLYGTSRHGFFVHANALEGLLNLLLSLILVKHYGIYGVALGTSISMTLFKLFVQPRYVCKSIGYSLKHYYVRVLMATCIKLAIPLGAFFLIAAHTITRTYTSIFIHVVMQTIIMVPIFFIIVLSKDDRKKIARLVSFSRIRL